MALALAFSTRAHAAPSRFSERTANRIGMHSMLSPSTPRSAKEVMFREASAAGASYIRVDLPLNAIFLRTDFFGKPLDFEYWAETDDYAELARQYGLKVLAVVHGTPWHIADCPAGTSPSDTYRCPPSDFGAYGEMVGKVARRYAGVIDVLEVVNEPDNPKYFLGDAAAYARTLSAAADAIHEADAHARVALGGFSEIAETRFMDEVLAAEPSVASKVDINTIHLRSSATGAARLTALWRRYFTDRGMNGPLWMTEFGYPADPAFQNDRSFAGGEQSQADFLRVSMPWVVGAGGDMLFVTERDWGPGPFATEGVLESPDPLTTDPDVRRRPAFDVVKAAAVSLEGTFPPGRSVYSQPRGSRAKVRSGRLAVRFSCPSPGVCPRRAVRLKLRGGGTMRINAPQIAGGASAYARAKLSRASGRLVRQAGRRGVAATVTDFNGTVLGAFTAVAR